MTKLFLPNYIPKRYQSLIGPVLRNRLREVNSKGDVASLPRASPYAWVDSPAANL